MKFGSGYNKVGTEHSLSLSNTRQSSLGQHSIWGGGGRHRCCFPAELAGAFTLNDLLDKHFVRRCLSTQRRSSVADGASQQIEKSRDSMKSVNALLLNPLRP